MEISLLPIFIVLALISLGYVCRKSDALSDEKARGISFFAMNIALPCLLLKAFTKIDFATIFDVRIYLTYFLCAFVIFSVGWLIARFILKCSATTCGLLGMASCFSNLGLIGLPIIEATWGDYGVGIFSIVVSIHPLVLFTLTMFVISRTAHAETSQLGHLPNPIIKLSPQTFGL